MATGGRTDHTLVRVFYFLFLRVISFMTRLNYEGGNVTVASQAMNCLKYLAKFTLAQIQVNTFDDVI